MTPLSGNSRGLAALVGAVELLAVDERALVVHLHDVGGLGRLAGAGLQLLVDQAEAVFSAPGSLAACVQERLGLLLLLHGLGLAARAARAAGTSGRTASMLHGGLLALHLGGDAGLARTRSSSGVEVEHADAAADGEPQRVQRLLVLGLRVGPLRSGGAAVSRLLAAGHHQHHREQPSLAHVLLPFRSRGSVRAAACRAPTAARTGRFSRSSDVQPPRGPVQSPLGALRPARGRQPASLPSCLTAGAPGAGGGTPPRLAAFVEGPHHPPGPPHMSPLIASTLDEISAVLPPLPPASESAPARALAHALRLAPSPDVPWSRVPARGGHARPAAVPRGGPARRLHLHRARRGQRAPARLPRRPRLAPPPRGHRGGAPRSSRACWTPCAARDEALGRIGRASAGPQADAALAEQDAAAAQAEARELLSRRAPVSLEASDRLMLRAHATAFPAPLALASVSGCNEARKRVLHQAVKGLAMSLQVRGDALNWEEDEARGASWAVCLRAAAWAARCPRHPPSCAAWCRAAAWWCGCGAHPRALRRGEARGRVDWLARPGEVGRGGGRSADMLARTERSPGHAVQWKAQHVAAV